MDKIDFFSLSDNYLDEIPWDIFKHMPNIGTLDLARLQLKMVKTDDFRSLTNLRHLILRMNQIQTLEKNSIPHTLESINIGLNNISSLNGTLRQLTDLKLMMIHSNNIHDLEDELPYAPGLVMFLASHNQIKKLPQVIKTYSNLNAIYVDGNELQSLDGVLSHAKKLQVIWANDNNIDKIAEDEFIETNEVDELQMSFNKIKTLNKSLLHIRALRVANFSGNFLSEFSLDEILGLRKLRLLDLSYNKIEKLVGRTENSSNSSCLLYELHLEFNMLTSLDGALAGLGNLRKLFVSHNQLEQIKAIDFDKMEELEQLDLSFNKLKTLKEFSKVLRN